MISLVVTDGAVVFPWPSAEVTTHAKSFNSM